MEDTIYVYPAEVRSLVNYSRTGMGRTGRICNWGLNISGPFCAWPRTACYSSSRAEHLADQISELLKLPVNWFTKRGVIYVAVEISPEVRDELIRSTYEKEVIRNAASA